MRRCIPIPDLDRLDTSGRTRELSIRVVREREIVCAEVQHGGSRLSRLEAQARVPTERLRSGVPSIDRYISFLDSHGP